METTELVNTLLRKIEKGERTLEDFEWFNSLSPQMLAHYRGVKFAPPTKTPYLHLISDQCNITISPCRGGFHASLAYASKTFVKIDYNFKNFATEQPATEITPVLVYEMHSNIGTFENIYRSFPVDWRALAFRSQEQIEKFVNEHRSWLCVGARGTFFLFTEKVNGKQEYFFAGVGFVEGFLLLEFHESWSAKFQDRFVLPATSFLGV